VPAFSETLAINDKLVFLDIGDRGWIIDVVFVDFLPGKTTFVNDKRNLKFVLESYYLRLIDLITVAVFLFTNFSNLQISKHQNT
jgi:hypothetical protein